MQLTPRSASRHSDQRGSVRTRFDIRRRHTSFGPELISTRSEGGWGTPASTRRTCTRRSISMPRQKRWRPVRRARVVDPGCRGSRRQASWSFFEPCDQHSIWRCGRGMPDSGVAGRGATPFVHRTTRSGPCTRRALLRCLLRPRPLGHGR
jgi:hypothetical protein